jgi:hypothetical protein
MEPLRGTLQERERERNSPKERGGEEERRGEERASSKKSSEFREGGGKRRKAQLLRESVFPRIRPFRLLSGNLRLADAELVERILLGLCGRQYQATWPSS